MDNTCYTFYCIEDLSIQYNELISFRRGEKYDFTPFYIGAYSYNYNSTNFAINSECVNKYFVDKNTYRNLIIDDIL